jgi:hypothetical protein
MYKEYAPKTSELEHAERMLHLVPSLDNLQISIPPPESGSRRERERCYKHINCQTILE